MTENRWSSAQHANFAKQVLKTWGSFYAHVSTDVKWALVKARAAEIAMGQASETIHPENVSELVREIGARLGL